MLKFRFNTRQLPVLCNSHLTRVKKVIARIVAYSVCALLITLKFCLMKKLEFVIATHTFFTLFLLSTAQKNRLYSHLTFYALPHLVSLTFATKFPSISIFNRVTNYIIKAVDSSVNPVPVWNFELTWWIEIPASCRSAAFIVLSIQFECGRGRLSFETCLNPRSGECHSKSCRSRKNLGSELETCGLLARFNLVGRSLSFACSSSRDCYCLIKATALLWEVALSGIVESFGG